MVQARSRTGGLGCRKIKGQGRDCSREARPGRASCQARRVTCDLVRRALEVLPVRGWVFATLTLRHQ